MRALVFTRPSVVELLDVDEPRPVDGEVVLRVAASGICGSELHGVADGSFRRPPLVMGHEFTAVDGKGRHVVVNPLLSCGSCDRCAAGQDHLCRSRQIIGIHRPGAFAERVAVPASAVIPLPDDVSPDGGAMIEPLANAVHAVGLTEVGPGSRIAVIGAGTIGLMSLLVARQRGAEVVVCDRATDRLPLAERLGAAETREELTGEYDVIVDAVGAPGTHAASVDRLRPGGTAIWIGLLSAEPGFDAQHIVREEKRVIGSYCYRSDEFAEAVELARTVPLDWATRFALDDGPRIFGELRDGRHDVVKALLHPGEV